MNVLPVLFEIFGDVAPNVYEFYQYSELPKQQSLRKELFKEMLVRVPVCAQKSYTSLCVEDSYRVCWVRDHVELNYKALMKGFASGKYKLIPERYDVIKQTFEEYCGEICLNRINSGCLYKEFLVMYAAIKLHIARSGGRLNDVTLHIFLQNYPVGESQLIIHDCFKFLKNPKVVPQNNYVDDCQTFFTAVISLYKEMMQDYSTKYVFIHSLANLFVETDYWKIGTAVPEKHTTKEILKYLCRQKHKKNKH